MRRAGLFNRTLLALAVAVAGLSVSLSPALAGISTLDRAGMGTANAIPAGPYVPGASYVGRNGYIEYLAGNLPVIFSAPHGGSLVPSEIPNRTSSRCGGSATTVRDTNTEELARQIQTAFFNRTGMYPHVIINRLHRQKLDANREKLEAACNDNEANIAFDEFHDFVSVAKARVIADQGRGWYTDLHGHGHSIQRFELGYLLTGSELRLSDATLDAGTAYEDKSSVRTFSQQAPLTFSALLRGSTSLGSLMAQAGYPSTPSGSDPAPDQDESYFSGGYNTDIHGCHSGGSICGVQIELNYAGVRDTVANRAMYAATLAQIYEQYLAQNFGISLTGTPPSPPAAPTSLTAVAGNAQVSLSWTASSGATTYAVNRGTATGGPYATIAPGVTSASYTDVGLSNGTTYYYVVFAMNAHGQSPDSGEASATPAAPVGGFTLSATPVSRSIGRGSSATYTINVKRTGGFTGPITLSTSQTPASSGMTYKFAPNPATGSSSKVSVITAPGTTPASYTITVTGTSGSLPPRTVSVTLVVTSGNCQGQC